MDRHTTGWTMAPSTERAQGGKTPPAQRRLVLLGISSEWREKMCSCPELALVDARDADDAVNLALRENSVILASMEIGEDSLRRLAISRASQTVPPVLLTCCGGEKGARRSATLDAVAHLTEPADTAYLRGVLDGSQLTYDGRRLRSATQVMRIQMLYELSSRLLRTMQRNSLAQVLGTTLPKLLEVPLILVALPRTTTPLPYIHLPN